jgi:hypothetical protein
MEGTPRERQTPSTGFVLDFLGKYGVLFERGPFSAFQEYVFSFVIRDFYAQVKLFREAYFCLTSDQTKHNITDRYH